MDVVRRNTDYAIRLMVNLARREGDGPISTRTAAAEEKVSYQLACKLMQSLHGAGLLNSSMGPKGGFRLGRKPAKISLLEIMEAIQGPVSVNRCVLTPKVCLQHKSCPVRDKLADLQKSINNGLANITLDELAHSPPHRRQGQGKQETDSWNDR